ncbi:MAG TPA: hypothetical protein VIJ18_11735 [Microbacteriaceae bacterium]
MGTFVAGPISDAASDSGTARPRDLVHQPEMFGQWGKPMRPAEGIAVEDARFVAASVQHWVANAIREEVATRRTNLASLLETLSVKSPELTFHRAVSLQHGDEPIQLVDLLVWASNFESVRKILVSSLGDDSRA